jgi:hypothetical protein
MNSSKSIVAALTSHSLYQFEKFFLKVFGQALPNFESPKQNKQQAERFSLVEFII